MLLVIRRLVAKSMNCPPTVLEKAVPIGTFTKTKPHKGSLEMPINEILQPPMAAQNFQIR